MKQTLKNILGPKLCSGLSGVKKAMAAFFEKIFLGAIKLMPDKALIYIKSNIAVRRKLDVKQGGIVLNIDSDVEYHTRLHSAAKEPEIERWFEKYFKKGDVFYDIGANVGAYSLIAAKFLNGEIRVYAFEPGFPNFNQLNKNIVINNLQDSITPLPIALCDETAVTTFNYNNITPGGALHALGEAVDYKNDAFEPILKQRVLAFRLDDLIPLFHIPFPNHIKIDVDGIEFKILQGADKTFQNPALRSLMLEVNEESVHAAGMTKFLLSRGLKLYSKYKYTAGGDEGPASQLFNYLFLRE